MASVTAIIRNDKKKKDGTAPIHFQIIKNRKKTKISSGIFVSPRYWDRDKGRVKAGHKNSGRMNALLQNRLAEIQDQVLEAETTVKGISAKAIKNKVLGKVPVDFFSFADELIEKYKTDDMIGTWGKNKSILSKFKKYCEGQKLTFHDIDIPFLLKYENFMRGTLSNKTNTVATNMKFLRRVFNEAYRQDLIEHQLNPFLKYRIKSEKGVRQFMTEDELLKLEMVKTVPGTKMDVIKDMFVFSAYTGGLRISDILLLRWYHFDGKNVNLTIRKTTTQLSVRVPNTGLDILKKYKRKNSASTDFIFPMLSPNLDMKDKIKVKLAISMATQYTNKNLKTLTKEAKLSRDISFHISRHTWATRALRKGISIDKVSKLMGHSEIRETQIYAKIVSEELDKAMEVFND